MVRISAALPPTGESENLANRNYKRGHQIEASLIKAIPRPAAFCRLLRRRKTEKSGWQAIKWKRSKSKCSPIGTLVAIVRHLCDRRRGSSPPDADKSDSGKESCHVDQTPRAWTAGMRRPGVRRLSRPRPRLVESRQLVRPASLLERPRLRWLRERPMFSEAIRRVRRRDVFASTEPWPMCERKLRTGDLRSERLPSSSVGLPLSAVSDAQLRADLRAGIERPRSHAARANEQLSAAAFQRLSVESVL